MKLRGRKLPRLEFPLMHVNDLPKKTQDYLKAIWAVHETSGGPATPGQIAHATGQKKSTVSEALKRLTEQGLVDHRPYAGIALTDLGNRLATDMVLRHRLLEVFLVEVLGYRWDEVHDDAELLEHSLTDRFIERLDRHLGYPRRDPHGDPIPRFDDPGEKLSPVTLADTREEVAIEQVDDSDPALLRYLADHRLTPGATVRVADVTAGLATIILTGADRPITLAESTLPAIRVRVLGV